MYRRHWHHLTSSLRVACSTAVLVEWSCQFVPNFLGAERAVAMSGIPFLHITLSTVFFPLVRRNSNAAAAGAFLGQDFVAVKAVGFVHRSIPVEIFAASGALFYLKTGQHRQNEIS